MTEQTAELTGTPKQVAWAEKIRAEILTEAGAKVQEYRQKAADTETSWTEYSVNMNRKAELYAAALSSLQAQAHAGFWIENRYINLASSDLVGLIAKGEWKLAGFDTRYITK